MNKKEIIVHFSCQEKKTQTINHQRQFSYNMSTLNTLMVMLDPQALSLTVMLDPEKQ
jgi:hypothetical protein